METTGTNNKVITFIKILWYSYKDVELQSTHKKTFDKSTVR